MARTNRRHKFRAPNLAKPSDLIRDPQITEEAYQLLGQGTSQKDLLAFVTSPEIPRAAPPAHKFKLRGPLKNQIPELDAFIAAGLAAGMTPMQLMAEVLPPPSAAEDARRAGIRERNERMNAKRAARQAALDDPEKRERERVSYQKKIRDRARRKAEKTKRLEAEAQKKAQALAENPTLAWRHPRRKGWKPPAGYPGADI